MMNPMMSLNDDDKNQNFTIQIETSKIFSFATIKDEQDKKQNAS